MAWTLCGCLNKMNYGINNWQILSYIDNMDDKAFLGRQIKMNN